MSLSEVGLETLAESVDHAGDGDELTCSPFQRTKSPREGPVGMAGSTSFSFCTSRELLPFSIGLEPTGTSLDVTGIVTLDPEPFDFADFFRLLLVSLASMKLSTSIDSDWTAIFWEEEILSVATSSLSLDFFKTSSANRSCNSFTESGLATTPAQGDDRLMELTEVATSDTSISVSAFLSDDTATIGCTGTESSIDSDVAATTTPSLEVSSACPEVLAAQPDANSDFCGSSLDLFSCSGRVVGQLTGWLTLKNWCGNFMAELEKCLALIEDEKDPQTNSSKEFHLPAIVHKMNHRSAGETCAPAAEPEKANVAVFVATITVSAAPPASVADSTTGIYPAMTSVGLEQLPENATAANTAAATYSIIVDLGINQKKVISQSLKYQKYYLQFEQVNWLKTYGFVVVAFVVEFQMALEENSDHDADENCHLLKTRVLNEGMRLGQCQILVPGKQHLSLANTDKEWGLQKPVFSFCRATLSIPSISSHHINLTETRMNISEALKWGIVSPSDNHGESAGALSRRTGITLLEMSAELSWFHVLYLKCQIAAS
ncbi:uncharacterized protein G2W53_031541 [Senna tora]|uniref:Uncharacterized protein n=1 Tax=Senna tora TaxID=362788 RepID=A0A834T9H8_9FABA|nr:uncharacterized protein G2W53_031541 [Senna tora]